MKKYLTLLIMLSLTPSIYAKAVTRGKAQKKQVQTLVLAEARRLKKNIEKEKDPKKKSDMEKRYQSLLARLS
jgi:hypothetical protein